MASSRQPEGFGSQIATFELQSWGKVRQNQNVDGTLKISDFRFQISNSRNVPRSEGLRVRGQSENE